MRQVCKGIRPGSQRVRKTSDIEDGRFTAVVRARRGGHAFTIAGLTAADYAINYITGGRGEASASVPIYKPRFSSTKQRSTWCLVGLGNKLVLVV